MDNNLSVMLKRFAVPTLFILIGILMLYVGIAQKQKMAYNTASALMFVAAILSFLYSTGKVKPVIINSLGALAGIAAIAMFTLSVLSVKNTVKYNEAYELCRLKSEENLKDIRFIQKRYAEVHGVYAKDWTTLVNFAKTGTVEYVDAFGVVPARKMTPEESKFVYKDNRPIDNLMTEKEAYILSKSPIVPADLKGFKRDTIQVSLLKTKFQSKAYEENRMRNNLGKFYADSLPFIPFTSGKAKWTMQTVDSVMVDGVYRPAILVEGVLPYAKIQGTSPDTLRFGRLTSDETGGNWE